MPFETVGDLITALQTHDPATKLLACYQYAWPVNGGVEAVTNVTASDAMPLGGAPQAVFIALGDTPDGVSVFGSTAAWPDHPAPDPTPTPGPPTPGG
jgi:hypothetical protein